MKFKIGAVLVILYILLYTGFSLEEYKWSFNDWSDSSQGHFGICVILLGISAVFFAAIYEEHEG